MDTMGSDLFPSAYWNVLDMANDEVDDFLSHWVDPLDLAAAYYFLLHETIKSLVPQPGSLATAEPWMDGMPTADEVEDCLSGWVDPADVNAFLDKLPFISFGLGGTPAVGCDSDSVKGGFLNICNIAYSPRCPIFEAPFDNPFYGQEQRTPTPIDSDSDTDSEFDFDFAVCSSSYSASGSSGVSSAASVSPVWSPVTSFISRYDNHHHQLPPTAGSIASASGAASYSECDDALVLPFAYPAAAAAAAVCRAPPPAPLLIAEASTSAYKSVSSSSSSSSRLITPVEDLTLDLGYSSLEDEALFRADMRDLEAFGLIGATTEQLLTAAVERSFGQCVDRCFASGAASCSCCNDTLVLPFACPSSSSSAAAAVCRAPTPPRLLVAEASSSASSSSSSRLISAVEDLTLDLGYSSLEDEALFRADMRDLEAFGLIGATTEQLLTAAVERSFGQCADRC